MKNVIVRRKKAVARGPFGIARASFSHKNLFVAAVVFSVSYGALEAGFQIFINRLFAALNEQGGTWATVGPPLAGVMGLFLFQILGSALSDFLRSVMEIKYTKQVLTKLFNHLSEIDQAILDRSESGDIVARTVEDSKLASKLFIQPITRMFWAVSILFATFGVLLNIAWEPALIILAVVSFLVVATALSTARLEKLGKLARIESSSMWSSFFEAFRSIKFIKVNNLQEQYRKTIKDKAGSYQNAELRTNRFTVWMETLQRTLFVLSSGSSIAIAIYYNTIGELSVAGVVTFVLVTSWLRFPFLEIFEQVRRLREIKVSFGRLNDLMELRPVSLDHRVVAVEKPALSFDKVNFGYDPQRLLLENATFEMPYGKSYGIVGKTGSGKSTVFDLLTGTYPALGGTVRVGQLSLNEATIYSARRVIAVAYQFPFLINDTIERNVTMLNHNISEERLSLILKVAQVDTIIAKMPKGILEPIGESGVQLSGGERKRIQIAQTLAKDAEVYMFDELTASLDQNTARTIMAAIKEFLKGKTLVFIEHRLDMVEDVDVLFAFQNKTLERVTHESIVDD